MSDDKKDQSEIIEAPAEKAVVDIDSLKVKILILCLYQNKLDQVGKYLIRRGWEATVVTKAEDAIQLMATSDFDFILISVDLVGTKVSMLPKFFSITFDCKSIVFAENHCAKANGRLLAAKTPYKIMESISGPTVQRKIKKILQEIYEVDVTSSEKSRLSGAVGTGGQMIRGQQKPKASGRKAGDFPMNQRFSKSESENGFESSTSMGSKKNSTQVISSSNTTKKPSAAERLKEAQAKWNEFNTIQSGSSNEEGQEVHQEKVKPLEGKEYAIEKEGPKEKSGPTLVQKGPEPSLEKSATQEGIKSKEHVATQEGIKSKEHVATQEGIKSKEHVATQEGIKSKEHKATQEGIKSKEHMATQEEPNSNGKSESQLAASSSSGTETLENGDKAKSNSDISKKPQKKKRNNMPESQHFLFSSVEETMKKCLESKEKVTEEVEEVSKLGVLAIHSKEISGFLIFACAHDKFNMKNFLKLFKKHLHNKLNKDLHEIIIDSDFVVNVDGVDFDKFAIDKGEFTLIDNHKSYEVVSTFYQRKEPLPKVSQPIGRIKTEIDPKDVEVDKTIAFDSYLYLSKNKKYYKFIKKGGTLLEKQKKKLLKNNTGLHIGREDVEAFYQFYVENIINNLIKDVNDEEEEHKAS